MNEQTRHLNQIITGHLTSDGAGVKLKRIINPQKHDFDPFLLLDEFKSEDATDYIGGFPDHPHRGFETVTYMLDGRMLHRDHLGNEGHLGKGDVQWMTAGRGIIHSEMPEQVDGMLHGFQLWLNLPSREKMQPAHYMDIAAKDIPHVSLPGDGFIKLIAGDYENENSKFTGVINRTATQPVLMDIHLMPGQQLKLPIQSEYTVLLYIYLGEINVETNKNKLLAGQLGQLVDGNRIHLTTGKDQAHLIVMAALPLNESVVQSGPFVMNTQEEIEQAFRDYRDGTLTE